jgi:GntR family transcriptional regulator
MPRNPGMPHYRRIANAIITSTIQRRAPGGQRVPSETAVARKFGVAKNTARRALDELRRLGYVTRIRGSGTFSTGQSLKTIFAMGYDVLGPDFTRMFTWLEHLLARRGYRLIVGDMGLRGEHIREAFRIEQIRQADAIVWQAPSHPLGVRASIAARRKLPKRMPLLCIADPLGLSLQGRHRIDLVHWDYPEAIRRILAWCDREKRRHPILVSRTDVTLFATAEAERAFVADLANRNVREAANHVVPWDAFDTQAGERFVRHVRDLEWKPDAFILQFEWLPEFTRLCAAAGMRPDSRSVWVFDSRVGERSLKMDFRLMAEVCSDLLLNRLEKPNRPNLRVALNVPVRRSRAWPAGDTPRA